MTSPGLDDAAESVCSWDRGVNSWSDAELDMGDWIDDEKLQDGDGDGLLEENEGEPDVEELEGAELEVSLEESENLKQATVKSAYALMITQRSAPQWKDIEQAHIGVSTGNSKCTKRHHKQKAHEKEAKDSHTRQSHTARAFCSFFTTAVGSDPVPGLLETEDSDVLAQDHPPFPGHLPVEVNHLPQPDFEAGALNSAEASSTKASEHSLPTQVESDHLDDHLDSFLSDISEDAEDLFADNESDTDEWYEDSVGLEGCLFVVQLGVWLSRI
ncbi:hypothetical protein BC835DRAFT_1306440 [Cytidiella melzeri]|nr:hypothetical protein BC835DRAFT_1306440 [Cytidiella melzeri]